LLDRAGLTDIIARQFEWDRDMHTD